MPSRTTFHPARWQSTQWPLIESLSESEDAVRRERALEKLCLIYNRPILAYLRELGFSPSEAEDVRQRFFIAVVQGRRLFQRAEKGKGRLRDFIKRSLKRFAGDVRREGRAEKRGGDVPHESIDEPHIARALRGNGAGPDEAFDRAWALGVLERAWLRVEEEAGAKGKLELWRTLQPHLVRWSSKETQVQVAARIGISATALSTELNRVRTRFRHVVCALLMEAAVGSREVEDEVRYLFQLLG